MRPFSMIGATALLCLACHPPAFDHCDNMPINERLPEPVLLRVSVSGIDRNADALQMDAQDDNLMIELQPAAVDSYFFNLDIPGLNPCGTASIYPQMQFTFLPGGAHELEYWLQKNGASSAHKTLHFYVKEAMTEQAWFYPSIVAYMLLIAGAIIYFWTLYNIRQTLKMQQIRSRIAADLHDEVSSDLSSISISMTTLERKKDKSATDFAGTMRDIKQTLADTQNNLSDTVWAIKPEKDTGGELFQRMQKFAQQMFASGEVQLTYINTIPPDKPLKINMEQRHNVFKIYKEAIHNIYKHAQATTVEVRIYAHPNGTGLDIRDNGIGFDLEAEREGSGISNYYWRAKENLIDFHLESAPGKGTVIQIIIPHL